MRSYSSISKNYFFDFQFFITEWEQDIQTVTLRHMLNSPIFEQDTKICAKINNTHKVIQKYCALSSDRNQINQEQIKLLKSFESCANMPFGSNVDVLKASKRCIDDAFKSYDLAMRYEDLLIETIEVTKSLTFENNELY